MSSLPDIYTLSPWAAALGLRVYISGKSLIQLHMSVNIAMDVLAKTYQ